MIKIIAIFLSIIASIPFLLATVLLLFTSTEEKGYGNCWTYAIPKWIREGGYLCIRKAHGVSFLGFLMIPHVMHISRTGTVSDFYPLHRESAHYLPYFTLFYKGYIRIKENGTTPFPIILD